MSIKKVLRDRSFAKFLTVAVVLVLSTALGISALRGRFDKKPANTETVAVDEAEKKTDEDKKTESNDEKNKGAEPSSLPETRNLVQDAPELPQGGPSPISWLVLPVLIVVTYATTYFAQGKLLRS